MSDIIGNAIRYSDANTTRSDPPIPHHGELDDNSTQKTLRFDCSGFVCHVILESGYRIDYESTGQLYKSRAFTTVMTNEIQQGDLILFHGHVGLVVEFNSELNVGKFIHMSGNNNVGHLKISGFKIPSINNRLIKFTMDEGYGTKRPIWTFLRIKKDRYSSVLDLHANGSNPHPTLRPLGTTVYSNYIRNQPKPAKSHLAKKMHTLPSHTRLHTHNHPEHTGYLALISRLWGKLPGH